MRTRPLFVFAYSVFPVLRCMSEYHARVCVSSVRGSMKYWRTLARQLGWSLVLVCQGCRFDHRSGYMQKSTGEYMNGWSNRSMFLFLSLSLSFSPPTPSLPQINEKKNRVMMSHTKTWALERLARGCSWVKERDWSQVDPLDGHCRWKKMRTWSVHGEEIVLHLVDVLEKGSSSTWWLADYIVRC